MIGLISLEVYNSIFNITEENNKFELYTGYLEYEFAYTQLKDKVAEVLGLSDITPEKLKHETFGTNIIETYRKLSTEKSQSDGFYKLLKNYVHSPFRDFESYLRIVVALDEDDIQLTLKQYDSKFTTYKIPPGEYTYKDLSEVLSRGFLKKKFGNIGRVQPNRKTYKTDSIIIDSDNVSLITRLRLGPWFKLLRYDKKSFFNTILGFKPY